MRLLLVSLLISVLCATPGWANAGLPMVVVGVPIAVLALVPVVLAETMVIRHVMKLEIAKVLGGVATANAFSTLLGYPLAWFLQFAVQISASFVRSALGIRALPPFDAESTPVHTVHFIFSAAWLYPYEGHGWWMMPGAGMIGLVPAFFVSFYSEMMILRRHWGFAGSEWRRALLAANLTSYGLLFFALLTVLCLNFRALDQGEWALTKLGVAVRQGKVFVSSGDDVESAIEAAAAMKTASELSFHQSDVHGRLSNLARLASVGTLSFYGANLEDSDLADVSQARSIRELTLAATNVRGEGLTYLAGWESLESLSIRDALLVESSLDILVNFQNLRKLELSNTGIEGRSLETIASLRQIRILDLSGNPLSADGVSRLRNLESLVELNLAETGLTDDGVAALSGLTGLKRLNLWNSRITDAGMKNLRALTLLESLVISSSEIRGPGLLHLRDLKKLTILNLSRSPVAETYLREFKASRPGTTVYH